MCIIFVYALVFTEISLVYASPSQGPFRTVSNNHQFYDVQAHRGGRGNVVESTLPSFAWGLIDGATTLELDNGITTNLSRFDWRTLVSMKLKTLDDKLITSALIDEDTAFTPPQAAHAIQADILSPTGTFLIFSSSHEGSSHFTTPEMISEAHRFGMKVVPWTVNGLDRAEELFKDGADGIITDCGGPNNKDFGWRLNIPDNVSSPAYTSTCVSVLDAMHRRIDFPHSSWISSATN
ncbi:hypothetical protein C8R48DRAFT_770441 [Suillus tomentosus]|nr:hypothetical protein C8R48DRAFT_770441 [Suillus tomentosus]